MTTACFMIAYWGDDEDVAFVGMGNDDSVYVDHTGFRHIFTAFERFICDGHITEVLEVTHADSVEIGYQYASDRCEYWREALREQGYAVSSKEEEE